MNLQGKPKGKGKREKARGAWGCRGCRQFHLFELKKDDAPRNALSQMRDHGCPGRFKGDRRQLFLMGVGFDSTRKGAVAYQIE